ncbi:site-specific DNA-methyltransferase, partial [Ralstonia sp.]|uniref:site-specific DNA-methyltransferase n=1 Tax=Ralstonia sp. TaxID=54061 RepID=UPI002580EDDB
MPPKKTAAPKAHAGDSAKGQHQPVDALVHKDKGRLFIPSREEAGQEADALAGAPTVKSVPLNPVTTRGQDPELYWLNKYGADDQQQRLEVDIRSLYRHEHIEPEQLIARLYRLKAREDRQSELFTNELHGNPLALDELDKPASYYRRHDKWRNRLIQGDSLLVMTSLLEREGMAGQVQCIYIDPPYGIKYGSNWQMRQNDRNVKDGSDENLSGEPEVIKAFRDTWELGIHSYLSYLRDRLLVAKELLSASGSCFVQISDENVHLVRSLMDEVFGSENFVSLITFKKTGGQTSNLLSPVSDYIVWYAKDIAQLKDKYNQLYLETKVGEGRGIGERYTNAITSDGKIFRASEAGDLPEGARFIRIDPLTSNRPAKEHEKVPYVFAGRSYLPAAGRTWSTTLQGLANLDKAGRIYSTGSQLCYIRHFDDFPATPLGNLWDDVAGKSEKLYVVQTFAEVIKRCILMTTDPGDLVLDPT